MSGNHYLNGGDFLMAGFDHELRRGGFAGNSCQIILDLAAPVSIEELRKRVADFSGSFPILNARLGGFISPRWKLPSQVCVPQVREFRDTPGLREKLFNEPLAMQRGELLRFDQIKNADGTASLIFTWAHALMDAPGAEHLLACIAHNEKPAASAAPPSAAKLPLKERLKFAWKYLHHLDSFCKAAPRSLGIRRPEAPATLKYHVEKFTAAETEAIRARGARLCGVLADAQFHAVLALVELHRLHERLGSPSPSYVLPVPVGLRRKGNIEPVFSNQVGMLMFQLLPQHLGSISDAIGEMKQQTSQAMRNRLVDSGKLLAELFRFLPLPLYMKILKQGLRGEICSLFYGDPAAVNPKLTTFLGVTVNDFTHAAPVTPSPGLGVIFYYFRGELRLTVLHSARVLNDSEAAGFAAGLRHQLLNG